LPRNTVILGTGSYLPDKVLSNRDLESMVDTTDEWIVERTGIRERRMAAKEQGTSDLALEASRAALDVAGLTAQDLDLIILATTTPDAPVPATACRLQAKLGAPGAAAFDISAACSGFLYGLSVADAMIRSGSYRRILLVGAEVLTRLVDWEDRATCVLFGDGAGAVVLGGSEEDRGIRSVRLHADGTLADLLHVPGGGTVEPFSAALLASRRHYLQMRGNELFKVAVRALEALVLDCLKDNGLDASEIALFIPHQANIRIIQATAERLGLSMDRVVLNVSRVGNTSGASIPIALDEANRAGRIRPGDNLLLEAFGAGLTWGSALITW